MGNWSFRIRRAEKWNRADFGKPLVRNFEEIETRGHRKHRQLG
jgi:hypothetical protein